MIERIVVSSQSQGGLDDMVSPMFGRCPIYTIVDIDLDQKEIKEVSTENNPAMQAMGGAGIQAAQLIGNLGAKVVISGNFGPNAFIALQQLEEALIEEVNRLGQEGPTPEELAKAKNQLSAAHVFKLTSMQYVGFEIGMAELVERNPILVTALNPVIGYDKAAQIAKRAYAEGRRMKEVAAEMTDLSPEELDRLLDPQHLTQGGIGEK